MQVRDIMSAQMLFSQVADCIHARNIYLEYAPYGGLFADVVASGIPSAQPTSSLCHLCELLIVSLLSYSPTHAFFVYCPP